MKAERDAANDGGNNHAVVISDKCKDEKQDKREQQDNKSDYIPPLIEFISEVAKVFHFDKFFAK